MMQRMVGKTKLGQRIDEASQSLPSKQGGKLEPRCKPTHPALEWLVC